MIGHSLVPKDDISSLNESEAFGFLNSVAFHSLVIMNFLIILFLDRQHEKGVSRTALSLGEVLSTQGSAADCVDVFRLGRVTAWG